ncbi:MAG: tetratricopeptide repeat protein [Acetobacter sp.]|nr:tetratricopeptide repeat protein [Acetobacter sp.]MBO7351135.1 tetratricopeptide repeat protein [Acetobacter sp.]
MDKKVKKKNPLKLKACVVALSLWGFPPFSLSSAPVMAAETASNAAQEQVARALFNKGFNLGKLHRYEEALAANNDLITRFGNSQDTKIQEQVALALLNKGADLAELHRYEEALAVNNDVIKRFGNSQNTTIQELVAIALLNKGVDLGRLDRVEQTRSVWKELVSYFWTSKDRDIQAITLQAQYRLPMLNMIPN